MSLIAADLNCTDPEICCIVLRKNIC